MNPAFDWDDANVRHIALHGITPLEVEQSTLDEKAVLLELQSVKDEERVQLVGMTPAGRLLAVVFTMRGEAIRPVTSYPATRVQQLEYLRQWKYDSEE